MASAPADVGAKSSSMPEGSNAINPSSGEDASSGAKASAAPKDTVPPIPSQPSIGRATTAPARTEPVSRIRTSSNSSTPTRKALTPTRSSTPMRRGLFGFARKRRPSKSAMKKAIKDILLSPAVSTEQVQQNIPKAPIKNPSREEVEAMLSHYVPSISTMKGRRGRLKVIDLILHTATKGLPSFKGDPTLTNHIKSSLLCIINTCIVHIASKNPDKTTTSSHKMIIEQLVDAFQACQAVQARVIDTLFGIVSCRDKTLADQILVIVDAQKQKTLNMLVNQVFKKAWTASDKTPQLQVPHLQNGMRQAFGARFGLAGVRAANIDASANKQVATKLKDMVTKLYEKEFSVDELASALVNDVNRADDASSRIINRDDLAKWAGSPLATDKEFVSHSIFYDEDHKDRYAGEPVKDQEYQPFLSLDVAMDILYTAFVMNDKLQQLKKERLKRLAAAEKDAAAAEKKIK